MTEVINNVVVIEHNSLMYKQALSLRNQILRKPLGLDIANDDLSGEKDEIHLGYIEKNALIGVLTFRPIQKGRVKMRQVAVMDTYQGQGLGRKLIEQSESYIKNLGYEVIELNSRLYAKGFYEKMGYEVISEVFQEVGIDHVKMIKSL